MSIKDKIGSAGVFAVDISSEALDIAMRNSDELGLDVEFECSNVLCSKPFSGKMFDAVISNPPYIPKERANMETRLRTLSHQKRYLFLTMIHYSFTTESSHFARTLC